MGADGIPAFLVKRCSVQFLKPLCILFNHSLRDGMLPEIWTTFITPIFKSGARNNVSSYRPVAMISAIPKLLDKLIYNRMLKF